MNNWTDDIDKTTQDFHERFGALNSEQLNWKPDAATWSIAQNLDHLIVINESYFPVIESIRKGTYKGSFLGRIGFVVRFFGRTVLNAVQPDRKKKIKTFLIWEPTESQIPDGILDRFIKHQSELKIVIEDSQDLIEKGTVISSPANRNLVYKLETAFDIMVTHEQRHLEQSKEIFQLLKTEISL